jgi:CarboxypepD_reg-like domain/Secretion system C-terminal sorting domain
MSKKIQLSIAEPCHENWENMSPVDKGKFCGSCQKQVVDFSTMSDRLVAEFFKKPSTGSVCGRFMSDQLEREIEIPRKRIPWVKYFFQIALPALFISKASAQKTMGKMIAKPVTKDTVKIPELRTLGLVAPRINNKPVCIDTADIMVKGDIAIVETKPITGRVIDENGQPVGYATITIKGTKKGVATKEDGTFSIQPTSNWSKIVLVVSSIGFELKETMIDRNNYQKNKKINIAITAMKYEKMGEVVVCKVDKKAELIAVIPEVIKDADTKLFKIYPNPVLSGTSLNIEWKKKEESYYMSQLLNQSGQSVHRQEVWIDAEARKLSIDMPFVSAGSYFLVLTNKKTNKKFAEKIIIQ